MDAVLVGGLSVLASGALLGLVATGNRRPERLQVLELRFGTDVTPSAVEAVLAGIAGLPIRSQVVLDVVADRDGIRHRLHAPAATIDVIKGHLRGVLPSARLDAVDGDEEPGFSYGVRLGWRDRHPMLQTGAGAETAAALLGSLASPLGEDESVMVRWSLRPARGPHLPVDAGRRPRQQRGLLETLWPSARPLPSEQVGALRNKYSGAVLHGTPTVLVRASNSNRAAHLAGRVTSVVRSRGGARGVLRVRRLSARQIAAGPQRPALGRGDRYSPGELAPLLGWPIDGPQIAGLSLGTAPILVPSPLIPTTGRVLGVSNAPGLEKRHLAQPVIGGLSHSLIVGGTGTGKSTTLAHLLKQDAEAGRGALVIDMKGDLVSDLLALIPERRHKDVIVLDPAAGGPVPGLKLFGAGRDPEITADVVLGVIRSVSSVSASWGAWSAKWLRAGLVTIAQDKTASLGDLPFLFTDDAYRARLVGRLHDPMLQATWAAYDAMSEAERQHQLAAPLGRVEEIIGRRLVRGVLSQQRPALDMSDALRRGRIVLVSLNPGVLGGPAARLLGALVVHALVQAVLARVALAPHLRRPFFAYLDEVKLLADLATPLPELFEMARGQGVGVVAAPQSLAQLPDELRRAALSNAGSLLAFRQNFDDSVLLARELPGIDAEGLQHLGRYEVAARLTLAPGDVAPTTTGRTLAPPEAVSDPDEVRRLSAKLYGVDPEETDRALRERHGLDDLKSASAGSAGDGADEPVGWQRRRAS